MRAWTLLQLLARDHRVDVVVVGEGSGPSAPVVPPSVTVTFVPCPPPRAPASAFARMVVAMVPRRIAARRRQARGWVKVDPPTAALLRAATEHGDYDRVVVFRMVLHDVLGACGPLPGRISLDLDDLESTTRYSIGRALLRRRRLRRGLATLADARTFRAIEAEVLDSYDEVFLAAPEDARALEQRLPSARIRVLPNCVEPPAGVPGVQNDGTLRILFVGSFRYFPNEDAALWLLEEILPQLRSSLTGPWRLTLSGRGASSMADHIRAVPEVDIVSDPEELYPLYAAASIVIAPVRCGGGTKLKVIEGMAYRRPVVATREAIRGLHVVSGQHCLIADDAAGLARACAALAADPDLAAEIAARGHELVCTSYRRMSW